MIKSVKRDSQAIYKSSVEIEKDALEQGINSALG